MTERPGFFSMPYEFEELVKDCGIGMPFEFVEIDPLYTVNFRGSEKRYSLYKDIDKLDGMFISGTSPKVLPINAVDHIKINPKNEIVLKIMKEYNDDEKKYIKNN